MFRKRSSKRVFAGMAIVLIVARLWGAKKMTSAPTGEDAARLAAAEFLGVEPGDLQPTEGVFAASRYDFLLDRDGQSVATVSMGRDPIMIRSGGFYGRSREAGEPQLDQAAAVKAARRFAHERLPGFRDLGVPSEVKPGRSGPLSTWEVTWNVYRKQSGWRFLFVQLNSSNGDVAWFMARKSDGPLVEPTVTREQAIATATSWWSTTAPPETSDVIINVQASIGTASIMRPDGYPVWRVKGLSSGLDGAVAGVGCTIDGITGEIIHPLFCSRERAIAVATQHWQDGAPAGSGPITNVEARIVTESDVRPPGYSVWDVTGVRVGPGDAKTRVGCQIDGVVGTVIEPGSRDRGLGPERKQKGGPAAPEAGEPE